jgi:hypothetical protein
MKIASFINVDQCRRASGSASFNGRRHIMAKEATVSEAAGLAALGICESLLIALRELKIISEQETRDLLTDVAATHKEAAHTARARPGFDPEPPSLRLPYCSAHELTSWAPRCLATAQH